MSTTESAAPTTAAAPRSGSRAALLLAVAYDATTLALALLAATAAAVGWLLLRSDAGRIDTPFRDAAAALTLCTSVVPAWTAWQWRTLIERGTTFGSRVARLAPAPIAPSRRLARLLLHPISVPAWCWLAATIEVAAAPGDSAIEWVAAGVGMLAVLLAALHLTSLLWRLLRPRARPLHARLAAIGASDRGEA